MCEGINVGLSW